MVSVGGKRVSNFCSNDYLGMAAHPAVIEAGQNAAKHGFGAGASHLVCGHHDEQQALEEELATWLGRERALVFSSGYAANLSAITTLVGKGDTVLHDRLNHASLFDGTVLSGAKLQRYLHNDIPSLMTKLSKLSQGETLVVSDGVFSMDGDMADLEALTSLGPQQPALMIDDAHGIGVLGASGGGVVQHYNKSTEQVPVLMGTLGKALGTSGAFIAGSQVLIESLIQFARPYIYTTAAPLPIAAATRKSLEIVQQDHERRARLHGLIALFTMAAAKKQLPIMPSPTAIQPLLVGDDQKAVAMSERLFDKGFWISAIRPPTVPAGTARLRITLTSEHSEQQIMNLVAALDEAWREQ